MRKNFQNKSGLLVFIIAVLLGVIAYMYFKDHPINFKKKTSELVPAETIPEPTTPEKESISAKTKTITQNEENYAINVEYPEISGLSNKTATAKINGAIVGKVDTVVEDFIGGVQPIMEGLGKNDLTIKRGKEYVAHNVVSISLLVSNYQSGAAHPNSFAATLHFNAKTGEKIELADLFKPESKYLDLISKESIADLNKKYGSDSSAKDWIKTGASPSADNYPDFMISEENFTVVFNPYQVAPGGAGIVQVPIPYSKLSTYLLTAYK